MKRGKLKKGKLKKEKSEGKPISKLFLTWIGPVAAAIMTVLYTINMLGLTLRTPPNQPPEIQAGIRLSQEIVVVGETISARVIVKDPDAGDEIHYFWAAHLGRIGKQLDRFQGPQVTYVAPDQPGVDFITVVVYDGEGETDREFRPITVTERGQR